MRNILLLNIYLGPPTRFDKIIKDMKLRTTQPQVFNSEILTLTAFQPVQSYSMLSDCVPIS